MKTRDDVTQLKARYDRGYFDDDETPLECTDGFENYAEELRLHAENAALRDKIAELKGYDALGVTPSTGRTLARHNDSINRISAQAETLDIKVSRLERALEDALHSASCLRDRVSNIERDL